jgi:hypothetical protein
MGNEISEAFSKRVRRDRAAAGFPKVRTSRAVTGVGT